MMPQDHVQLAPPWLWRSGHMQTVRAAWSRAEHWPYVARQHILVTSDDDRLVLHEDIPDSGRATPRCVLLVHGLGGSHLSPYMVRIAHKMREAGVHVFRLDMRGCGAGWSLARQPGHAGRSEDVAVAVHFIRRQFPEYPLALIGFSLGGNIVLKLLGEWNCNGRGLVDRVLAVAPPVDLAACARNIGRPAMFLYNRWFIRMLLTAARRRAVFDPEVARRLEGPAPRSLYEFDDRVTAPLSGFSGADEYYARCSAGPKLLEISVSSLILTAADDPLIPHSIFSSLSARPELSVEVTRHGGHVGFFSRPDRAGDPYWLDRRVIHFVASPRVAPDPSNRASPNFSTPGALDSPGPSSV
jgi:uncharacterized protein